MRFWLTKNSELPLHDQLVRQVMLAILSEDLPAGNKLPSIRALAQRYRIHSNTVSTAYHELVERGWLELRRGSGIYVRPVQAAAVDSNDLDILLAELLRAARAKGHQPEDVSRRLEQLIRPRNYERVVIVEPEAAMREILQAEVAEPLNGIAVESIEFTGIANFAFDEKSLVTTLPTRAEIARKQLPQGMPLMTLRLRSVRESIELYIHEQYIRESSTGERKARPARTSLIAVVSKSEEFRRGARTMLFAVGLAPECLCEIDAATKGWEERLASAALVIGDVVATRSLSTRCPARVFRVISDSSIAELQQLCGALSRL